MTCALDIGALVRPQLRHVRRRVHLAHGEWLLNNLEALNNRFGRRLLASIDNEFGNEAAVIDVRTGGLRRLGAPVAAVSRDGRWIVGQSAGAELPFSIVIAPVDGGRPRTVAHGAVCCPDWNR